MKTFLIFVFLTLGMNCFSQIEQFYVDPILTNNNYIAEQDSHLVVRNTTLHNNKLFLFIGGTGSSTKSYLRISEFAGGLGFDVINLSYPNDVAAASLKNSTDTFAFDKYRQEICYGTPQSDAIAVDSLNSIQTRVINLIQYLQITYPTQNWNQYLLSANTLNWSKIAVGGHSQGGGHASYFAKSNEVDRVLMLSSPNDYSDHFSGPANWLSNSSATPIQKHFTYLSLYDEVVDFNKQLQNIESIGIHPLHDTVHVDASVPPYENSRCLYTTQSPGLTILKHNSPVKFSVINNAVWEYMLTTPSEVTGLNLPNQKSVFSIHPNPVISEVTVLLNDDLINTNFLIRNIDGQLILSGNTGSSELLKINLSTFKKGLYFISIGDSTLKLIKQ